MRRSTPYHYFFVAFVAYLFFCSSAYGQTTDTTHKRRILRDDIGIVKSLTWMPYATISYNLQSGEAFPKSAQGIGYGFGIAFDLTEDKQPLGVYFDFAYQDMRAHANNGTCALTSYSDTVSVSLPVTHYFSYVLLEGFAKLQSEKSNGYFLIGASLGLATTSLTVREGAVSDEKFADWKTLPAFTPFRLDIRAGIGIKLFYISGHQLVFEARFGYPVTNVISDYSDFCNGSNAHGPWRIVTLQGNFGLRL